MNITALGAGTEKVQKIIFISSEHEKFYYEKLENVRCQDVYHKALVYCLGISNDTRRNINRIYDFKTGCVKTESLREGWQAIQLRYPEYAVYDTKLHEMLGGKD